MNRLRRLRSNPLLRTLRTECRIHPEQLIQPIFITDGVGKTPIHGLDGQYRYGIDTLTDTLLPLLKDHPLPILLFGSPVNKQDDDWSLVTRAIQCIKQHCPSCCVIADVCLCAYTTHGHCGPVHQRYGITDMHNDATLPIIAQQAVAFADAGADIIAPSGMVDGMVRVIREALDHHGHHELPILSYSAKFASHLYGPFRTAVGVSIPECGRSGYQLNPANRHEAMQEIAHDIQEGADAIMVKPALPYLDIMVLAKQHYPHIPLAAYQVSGEYAMIRAGAQQGFFQEHHMIQETLLAITRAGADWIITYNAWSVLHSSYTHPIAKCLL
jgi:porphobilinogen synthase